MNKINFKKISVLHRKQDLDYVWVYTDLPAPFPKLDATPLVITFQLPAGTAGQYVRDNLGVEPDDITNG